MLPRSFRFLVLAVLPLAACAEPPRPDYSVDYTEIPVVDARGRPGRMTVAEACLRRDDTENAEMLGRALPPGCANAHNLQLMVERKEDLKHGRRMGAAPAAPSVRAAQRYIYGEEGPLAGAVEDANNRGSKTVAPDSAN